MGNAESWPAMNQKRYTQLPINGRDFSLFTDVGLFYLPPPSVPPWKRARDQAGTCAMIEGSGLRGGGLHKDAVRRPQTRRIKITTTKKKRMKSTLKRIQLGRLGHQAVRWRCCMASVHKTRVIHRFLFKRAQQYRSPRLTDFFLRSHSFMNSFPTPQSCLVAFRFGLYELHNAGER